MRSTDATKGTPARASSRSIRSSMLRLVRMAVAFVVVAGSLGLATVTATAQSGGSSCPSADAQGYADVDPRGTHADNITCIRELGIPAPGDAYRPSDDMTRSEMARFMAQTYKAVTGEEAEVVETAFTDVDPEDPNADDIARVFGLGITTGTSTTTYSPDNPVIRGHMALFLTRLYRAVVGSNAPSVRTPFTDIAMRRAEERASISRVFGLGVTTGTTATTYSPLENVTREQMGSFVARMYRVLDAITTSSPAGPPTSLEVAVSGTDGTALSVSWSAPDDSGSDDVTSYVVQWKTGADGYSEDNQQNARSTSATVDDLTQGDTYTFRVAAVSGAGTGEWSDETSGTPVSAPGVVSNLESVPQSTSLALSWTAPADDGGSEITGYVVSWKTGSDDYSEDNQQDASDTSADIEGLTQGETYTLRVAAVSDAGTGEWSDEISSTPVSVPGLVSNLKSVPRNASLVLSWTAPADDGGSEITGYVIRWKTGRQATVTVELDDGAATSYTITGLRNSLPYSVWVRAVNAAGTGDSARVPSGTNNASVTPTPTAPSVPRDLTVTPGNQMLTLRWIEPADDGGTTFTGYTIERLCGDNTQWFPVNGSPQAHNPTSLVQSITVRGLANGTHCDMRVGANSYYDADRNNFRNSNEPLLSSPWATGFGTPATLPGAPTNVMVTTAHQSLQVSWTPPVFTGGSAITGYKLTWSAGIPDEITIGNRTSYTITGLDNRYSYTVNVKTITAVGESTNAFSGVSVQPRAVPAAPRNVVVNTAPQYVAIGERNVNAGTSLVVTWDAPPSNGTNPVDGYVVQRRDSLIPATTPGGNPTPASHWIGTGAGTVDIARRTVTITGLQTGRSYEVRVQATNDHDSNSATPSIGGPWAMGSGTPATVPSEVTPILEPGHRLIIVSWNAPADNGSDITHYLLRYAENNTGNEQYSADIRVNAPANRTRITGLDVGVPYVVQVQAVNAIGTGPNLATETQAVTGLIPDAPTSVTAVPTPDGNGNTLTVTWSRVTRTNGTGPVTSYIVETRDVGHPGNPWTQTLGIDGNTTMATVNVVKGRTYLVRVKAVAGNTGSSGYIAAPVKAAGAPAAPAQLAATLNRDGRTVNVVWTAVAQNTPSDIISYTVSWYSNTNFVGGSRGSVTVFGNTIGNYALRGLAPDSYTVRVTANNHIGTSPPRTANVTVPRPPAT